MRSNSSHVLCSNSRAESLVKQEGDEPDQRDEDEGEDEVCACASIR